MVTDYNIKINNNILSIPIISYVKLLSDNYILSNPIISNNYSFVDYKLDKLFSISGAIKSNYYDESNESSLSLDYHKMMIHQLAKSSSIKLGVDYLNKIVDFGRVGVSKLDYKVAVGYAEQGKLAEVENYDKPNTYEITVDNHTPITSGSLPTHDVIIIEVDNPSLFDANNELVISVLELLFEMYGAMTMLVSVCYKSSTYEYDQQGPAKIVIRLSDSIYKFYIRLFDINYIIEYYFDFYGPFHKSYNGTNYGVNNPDYGLPGLSTSGNIGNPPRMNNLVNLPANDYIDDEWDYHDAVDNMGSSDNVYSDILRNPITSLNEDGNKIGYFVWIFTDSSIGELLYKGDTNNLLALVILSNSGISNSGIKKRIDYIDPFSTSNTILSEKLSYNSGNGNYTYNYNGLDRVWDKGDFTSNHLDHASSDNCSFVELKYTWHDKIDDLKPFDPTCGGFTIGDSDYYYAEYVGEFNTDRSYKGSTASNPISDTPEELGFECLVQGSGVRVPADISPGVTKNSKLRYPVSGLKVSSKLARDWLINGLNYPDPDNQNLPFDTDDDGYGEGRYLNEITEYLPINVPQVITTGDPWSGYNTVLAYNKWYSSDISEPTILNHLLEFYVDEFGNPGGSWVKTSSGFPGNYKYNFTGDSNNKHWMFTDISSVSTSVKVNDSDYDNIDIVNPNSNGDYALNSLIRSLGWYKVETELGDRVLKHYINSSQELTNKFTSLINGNNVSNYAVDGETIYSRSPRYRLLNPNNLYAGSYNSITEKITGAKFSPLVSFESENGSTITSLTISPGDINLDPYSKSIRSIPNDDNIMNSISISTINYNYNNDTDWGFSPSWWNDWNYYTDDNPYFSGRVPDKLLSGIKINSVIYTDGSATPTYKYYHSDNPTRSITINDDNGISNIICIIFSLDLNIEFKEKVFSGGVGGNAEGGIKIPTGDSSDAYLPIYDIYLNLNFKFNELSGTDLSGGGIKITNFISHGITDGGSAPTTLLTYSDSMNLLF